MTTATWTVALIGLLLISLLSGLQSVDALRPRAPRTTENINGGSPDDTDPADCLAFNQATAWADPFRWAVGFLLALVASVPFWYTAVYLCFWDRDLGFCGKTLGYWVTGAVGRSSVTLRVSTASFDFWSDQ